MRGSLFIRAIILAPARRRYVFSFRSEYSLSFSSSSSSFSEQEESYSLSLCARQQRHKRVCVPVFNCALRKRNVNGGRTRRLYCAIYILLLRPPGSSVSCVSLTSPSSHKCSRVHVTRASLRLGSIRRYYILTWSVVVSRLSASLSPRRRRRRVTQAKKKEKTKKKDLKSRSIYDR